MTKIRNNDNREENMRIARLISEGGLGVYAYYDNEDVMYERSLDETRQSAKNMVNESGLGAQFYYSDEEIKKLFGS